MTTPLRNGALVRGSRYHDDIQAFCRRIILSALAQHQGNRTRTAASLGLERTYLVRLIRRHGIVFPSPPSRE